MTANPKRIIRLVSDQPNHGIKPGKLGRHSKHIPWVDVGDEEDRHKKLPLKRNNGMINGHDSQNGRRHKKPRHSHSNMGEGLSNSSPNGINLIHRKSLNGAGPSSSSNSKAVALQEERRQLPIAKGDVSHILIVLDYSCECAS